MPDEPEYGGPYLQAALFCEKLLQERDGILSIIRVVDRLIVTASGPEAPAKLPPGAAVSVQGVLMFKSGIAKGSFEARIHINPPSRQRQIADVRVPIFLEGDDRGINVPFNMNVANVEEGLYWFDVFLNDVLMTRMPLRIVYQRIQTPGVRT